MTGPIGPPGFNGSQGAAGPRGGSGPQGPKGAGNFSSCQYKVKAGAFIPGNPRTLASKTEPNVSVWQIIVRFRDESFVLVSMLLVLSN